MSQGALWIMLQSRVMRFQAQCRHIGTNPVSLRVLAIYHSSGVNIGKAKRVSSILRDNQVNRLSTAGTLHSQVRRNPSGKRSFVELPIMEARIIAHSVFISYSDTPVNLWRRRLD